MKKVMYPADPILLIDDERDVLFTLKAMLHQGGITNVKTLQNSDEWEEAVADQPPSVVFLDLKMPGKMSGEILLELLLKRFPDLPVIIVTGTDSLESAVKCFRRGAYDYLSKPVDSELFRSVVTRALERWSLLSENRRLKDRFFNGMEHVSPAFAPIITRSSGMFKIFDYIDAVCQSSEAVLLRGGSGVGKELFARAVHEASGRTGKFVPVNVAGLDDVTFSDTLFGHKKGAFTSADSDRTGLVEEAAGGTLFLDEIGDLKTESQLKLLRLLQEKEYYVLGASAKKRSEASIVAATNADLKQFIDDGTFRSDLYYRLSTHEVMIPSLKERKEDIPLLVEYFLEQSAESFGKKVPTYPPELIGMLETYHFPGNIRELRSLVFNAVSLHSGGVLSLDHFKSKIFPDYGMKKGLQKGVQQTEFPSTQENCVQFGDVLPSLKEMDYMLIQEALKRSGGSQANAARMLGITPQAMSSRLKKLQ